MEYDTGILKKLLAAYAIRLENFNKPRAYSANG